MTLTACKLHLLLLASLAIRSTIILRNNGTSVVSTKLSVSQGNQCIVAVDMF